MLTVGQILRTTREKKNLSLQQVEKHSRIRAKFLQALEENNWSSFSSKIYITGLIKNYSKFLGLDENKMLAFFRRDYERSEETRFRQRISTRSLMPETRTVIYVGLFIVFLLFSVYFGYQIKIYLTPPKVTVVSPQKSTFRSTSRIQVIGRTEKEATISIFGDRVYQNKDGVFEYSFPLKKGKNELVIEVTGANGKKTVYKKTFVLE